MFSEILRTTRKNKGLKQDEVTYSHHLRGGSFLGWYELHGWTGVSLTAKLHVRRYFCMCGSESILKMLADGLTANAGVREKKPRKARPKEGHTDEVLRKITMLHRFTASSCLPDDSKALLSPLTVFSKKSPASLGGG